MGKSTLAAAFRRMAVPVHDADAVVHRLQAPGGPALGPIEVAFPGTVRGGVLDRAALGARVFGDRTALRRLEAILHPMVRRAEERFLAGCRRRGASFAVLDIPLLFETGAEARCDVVLVVSAPAAVQRARVLRRPGMTHARLAQILARQLPDREKRRRADAVIPTGLSRHFALARLARVMAKLRSAPLPRTCR